MRRIIWLLVLGRLLNTVQKHPCPWMGRRERLQDYLLQAILGLIQERFNHDS